MKNHGGDNPSPFCYSHPSWEVAVGVCALCLTEKLLPLASKQGRCHPKEGHHGSFSRALRKKPSVRIPKVFALGSSFLHRLDYSWHHNLGDDGGGDGDDSTDSLDDSFISIKFEDDGQVSWDKEAPDPDASSPAASRGHHRSPQAAAGAQSPVVDQHPRRPPRGATMWRKRIGRLLQLQRWKRSCKAGGRHAGLAGKVEWASGKGCRARGTATQLGGEEGEGDPTWG